MFDFFHFTHTYLMVLLDTRLSFLKVFLVFSIFCILGGLYSCIYTHIIWLYSYNCFYIDILIFYPHWGLSTLGAVFSPGSRDGAIGGGPGTADGGDSCLPGLAWPLWWVPCVWKLCLAPTVDAPPKIRRMLCSVMCVRHIFSSFFIFLWFNSTFFRGGRSFFVLRFYWLILNC